MDQTEKIGSGERPVDIQGFEWYEELLHCLEDPADEALEDSHIGLTLWTAEEKDTLFRALALKGRSDVAAIAIVVGSKTEVEVSAYLNLLEHSLKEIYQKGDPQGWLLYPQDMPSAYEVSEQCCEALEGIALAYNGNREQAHDIRTTTPDLLAIDNFPRLSEDIFMNSSRQASDRPSYSPDTLPSIQPSALNYFNAHMMHQTRRLVSTALFLASSRIRASIRPDRKPESLVRPDDVDAAARILGLAANLNDFWVHVARRNGLTVLGADPQEGHKGRSLRLRDVERRLQRPGNFNTINEDMATDSSESSVSTSFSEDDQESQVSPSPSPSLSERSVPLSELSNGGDTVAEGDPQDIHLERLDMLASRREEIHLWKLIGREPPDTIAEDLHQASTIPESHDGGPLSWNEQRDWRFYTDSTPAWTAQPAQN